MDDGQGSDALRGAASGASAGAAFGPWGAAIGGVAGGLMGFFGHKKRPTYTINPEVEQNKALGIQAAFGQNAGIAQGEAMADQTATQDINTAQQYSSNAGTILNTLKAINNNRNQTKQGLAISDAQLRAQGRGVLMGANNASIDEKDKAWNYNVNQPYQNQIAANREAMRGTTENFWKMLDYSRAKKLYDQPGINKMSSSQLSGISDNGLQEQGFGSGYVGMEEA